MLNSTLKDLLEFTLRINKSFINVSIELQMYQVIVIYGIIKFRFILTGITMHLKYRSIYMNVEYKW